VQTMTLCTRSVFSIARIGMAPASIPSSAAAALASSSRRALNAGSTHARATSRAPSAGVGVSSSGCGVTPVRASAWRAAGRGWHGSCTCAAAKVFVARLKFQRTRRVREATALADNDEIIDVHQIEFEEWLRAEPENEVVGEARNPLSAPLAHFLRERFRQAVLVGKEKVRLGDAVFRLPDWAREYLRLADASPSFAPITAREALELLERLGPESRPKTAGTNSLSP
jgi:hypothetical protein